MTIAVLDMDIRNPEGSEWSDRVERLDCYALGSTDLTRYAALIITPSVDQEYLARTRHVISAYLDGGGVVVFGGHLNGAGYPVRRRSSRCRTGHWPGIALPRLPTIRSSAASSPTS